MSSCYFCGKELDIRERVMRKDLCPSCGRNLRCCVQCRFHDPGYHNQCREPKAGMVREREKANLCDYFSWSGAKKGDEYGRDQSLAKKALDDLFKKS